MGRGSPNGIELKVNAVPLMLGVSVSVVMDQMMTVRCMLLSKSDRGAATPSLPM